MKISDWIYRIALLVITILLTTYLAMHLIIAVVYSLATPKRICTIPSYAEGCSLLLVKRKVEINSYVSPRILISAPFVVISWFLCIKTLKKNKTAPKK